MNNPIEKLDAVISDRLATMPEGSYTAYLATGGLNRTLKKFGEESTELVVALASESDERVVSEAADLLYVLDVALQFNRGIRLAAIFAELDGRNQEE